MYFVLDHYYAIDNKEFCLVLQNNMYNTDEVIELCSAITFYLEELVNDNSVSLDNPCLCKILTKYYGFTDVKETLGKDILSSIKLPIEGTKEVVVVSYPNKKVDAIFIIDLYGARESCCGPNWKNLLDKWIFENSDLEKGAVEDIASILLKEGIEK